MVGTRRHARDISVRTILVAVAALLLPAVLAPAPAGAATGSAPTVSVGADQILNRGDTAFLRGRVSDDGLPDPSVLTTSWSVVSGPGEVTFGGDGEAHTSADFSAVGVYVLRLTAFDGGGSGSDELTVTVREAPSTTVNVPADYPTIQQALDAAPAHALVLVAPGTYHENLYVPRTLTLASTFYTTGDPAMVEQTVVSAVDSGLETVLVSSSAGPDTRIVGFTVRDGKDGIKVRGAAVVEHNLLTSLGTDGVDFPRDTAGLVQHNVMRGNGDDGVDVNESSTVIVDNLMERNAGDGVETRTTNVTAPVDEVIIRGNRILDNEQDGLQIIDDDTITTPAQSATLFTIDRNVIAGNLQAGLGLMDGGTTSEDYRGASLVERILVTNNTFAGNNHGVTGGDNLVAVNNIFTGHVAAALKNVDGASEAAYNQFFANGAPNASSNVDPATSFVGDPMLDADFAPLPGSPVVDAGTATYTLAGGELAVDIAGYQGAAPDLGAVESASGTGGNQRPVVDAGADVSVTLPDEASLVGSVSDDGLPEGGSVSVSWEKASGPGVVTFSDAGSLVTSAGFSEAGSYVLRLTASDGELSGSDTVAVSVAPAGGAVVTAESRPSASTDDAEERSSGSVSLSSSDLELVTDGSTVQTVGVRFPGVAVPQGASVAAAWIQFQTDEVSSGTADLRLAVQDADDAAAFSSATRSVSGRPWSGSVAWAPSAWSVKGERGAAQRTPDLSGLVQQVVSRPGWASGNAMAFGVTGTGTRTAEAFDGEGPVTVLHVEYVTGAPGEPKNQRPVVDAGDDVSVTLPDEASLVGSVSDDGLPEGGSVSVSWEKASGPGAVSFSDAGSLVTSAGFSEAGSYVLRLTASDGELSGSDTVAVSVAPAGGAVVTAESRPAASTDDAEERSSGSVSLNSSDLELVTDGSRVQTVGVRFPGVAVPQGASVVAAWIQFQTDEVSTGAADLRLSVQDADAAAPFVNSAQDVSSRPRFGAVSWAPLAWSVKGERGAAQRTPDLTGLVQRVVSRPGWAPGNAMAFVVTGSGTRTAEAFDGEGPVTVLHVEYVMP